MNRSASLIFQKLHEAGSKAFDLIRDTALSPSKSKTLREWGITEASLMIGRSSQTLRNLEETGKIPKARTIDKGRKLERIYNLKEINHLRDFFDTRPHKPKNAEPAILGFANFKGGAGKTTTAINTAQYFAKKGYKVLFIDSDSQGSATGMFGYIPDRDFDESDTILNLLTDVSNNLDNVIKQTYWDGLDLIPANLSLYNAELMIPIQIAEHSAKVGKPLPFYNRLNNGLKTIYDQYDIIIIDCPPSMGMISTNAIFAANALIIEMPPVIVDFASTIQFFKMVSEIMERLPKKAYSFIRLLLTKYNGRTTAEQLKDTLKRFFGQYIMSNTMIESEVISKASSDMLTLYEIDKFKGDHRTFDRAIQQSDRVNEEIENLLLMMWDKVSYSINSDIEEKELIE